MVGNTLRWGLLAGLAAAFSAACAETQDQSIAQNSNGGTGNSSTGGNGGSGGVSNWPDSGATGGSGGAAGSAATGGTGALGGNGGSGGGCVPQCSGKACGPDSCGGTCAPGCAAGETCSVAGTCSATCSGTWYTALPSEQTNHIVLDGGDLFVVGTKADTAWVGKLDTCAGQLAGEKSLTVSGASKSGLSSAVVVSGSLYAAGSVELATDPGNGLFAKVSTATLAQTFANSLWGGNNKDEIYGLAGNTSGSFWMIGASGLDATTHSWSVKGTAAGQACGFPTGATGSWGKAVAVNGNDVYLARLESGAMVVDRYSDTACSATGPCPCTAVSAGTPIQIGTGQTEARALLYYGGALYVAGFAWDAGQTSNAFAFVARLDASANLVASYEINPTGAFDGFLALATDGKSLYVGGGQGWDQGPTFATATAILHALPLGFGNNVAATWTRSFSTLDIVNSVAPEFGNGDGVMVSGLASGGGYVMRCLKSGQCAK